MRHYLLAGLVAGAQLAAAASCNANNCLRQVRATQTITVTAETETAASTETDIFSVVTTSTAIDETQVIVVARQVTQSPSEIPAYASSCPDVAAYSSACSCIGITAITTTFGVPTSTAILTVSVTASASTGTTTATTTSTTSTTTFTMATTTSTTSTTTYVCPTTLPTQVVKNPGFESALDDWSLAINGYEVVYQAYYCGVTGEPNQNCDHSGYQCNCLGVDSNSPGGSATLRQVLTVCPGREYSFVAYVGLDKFNIPGGVGATTIGASLGGVTLFEPFLPCVDANLCPVPGASGNFLKIGPITVTPQLVNPVLEFDFVSTHPTTISSIEMYVVDIKLTLI